MKLKNIFLYFMSFIHESFKKSRYFLNIIVAIKIINKIFFIYNKIYFKNM